MRSVLHIAVFLALILPAFANGQNQPAPASVNDDEIARLTARDSLIRQRIDSRRGYVFRVPGSATLDSSRSGWSQEKQFEKRVYVLQGAGEIVITATIAETEIPENVTKTQAYTWEQHDSSTSAGSAWVRTYYLPTRHVRIEIIPYGIAMHPYMQEREFIFNSFRWKPGAETDAVDLDVRPNLPPPTSKPATLGG